MDGYSVEAATAPGRPEKENQDRHLVHEGPSGLLVAVVDGATTPGGARPDGGDYAQALVEALATRHEGAGASPRELLTTAIGDVVEHLGLPSASSPSASAVVILIGPEVIEGLVLGDCSVVVTSTAGVEVHSDRRLGQLAEAERERYHRLVAWFGRDDARSREAHERLVEVERAVRNVDGGYWIAADRPEAAAHALSVGPFEAGAVTSLVLATDGAMNLVERPELVEAWDALRAGRLGAGEFTARLVELDGEAERSDDATVLVVRKDEAG